MIKGIVKYWDLGRSKARGMFGVTAKSEEDFNNLLLKEFSKHLISNDVWFEKGKIFAGCRCVGNFEFIAQEIDSADVKNETVAVKSRIEESIKRADKEASKSWGKPLIKWGTLEKLISLAEKVYPNKWRVCLDICPVSVIKTIDNEEDAQETIKRLEKHLKVK